MHEETTVLISSTGMPSRSMMKSIMRTRRVSRRSTSFQFENLGIFFFWLNSSSEGLETSMVSVWYSVDVYQCRPQDLRRLFSRLRPTFSDQKTLGEVTDDVKRAREVPSTFCIALQVTRNVVEKKQLKVS